MLGSTESRYYMLLTVIIGSILQIYVINEALQFYVLGLDVLENLLKFTEIIMTVILISCIGIASTIPLIDHRSIACILRKNKQTKLLDIIDELILILVVVGSILNSVFSVISGSCIIFTEYGNIILPDSRTPVLVLIAELLCSNLFMIFGGYLIHACYKKKKKMVMYLKNY